ncbi:MAG: type IV secretion system DNA-binding domain-containing protein [Patescibacteria group bacterium]
MASEDDINVFAVTNFRNRNATFGIKTDDRRRHVYILGKTGMGKTTMMENMAVQDIHKGHGLCFIDPHGEVVERLLDQIPPHRINDVIYFNPSDLEHPISFNILESVDPNYKHLVASGLMGVFTKIWAGVWSARMEYILGNTILALLDSPGNTMLGIARMLVDKVYRKKIIEHIKDPMVKSFWVNEYANYNDKFRNEAIAPIQNKVGQFLSSAVIRNIVGQTKSTLNLREIMDKQKILLVDLSKGRVGEDNSSLLGAMLITRLQLAAMSRIDIPEEERKDFFLYVDEFQNFATDSFATILSEARKYRLSLIIAHQYIGQLVTDKNTRVRDAVFGNVGTMLIFRIGSADAEFLETEFDPTFTPSDLINLPKYGLYLKLLIDGITSNPFSATTLPPLYKPVASREKVIRVSRERYTNPRAAVEQKIARWLGQEYYEQSALEESEGHGVDEAEDMRFKNPEEPKKQIPAAEPVVNKPSEIVKAAPPAKPKPAENPIWDKVQEVQERKAEFQSEISKVLDRITKKPAQETAKPEDNQDGAQSIRPGQKIKF